MFVFNDGNHDQRVHKQAQALGRQGYDVRVYCFLTAGQKTKELRDGYTLLREDQRSHVARFFDDQVMGRLRKKKDGPAESPPTPAKLEPLHSTPRRPCSKPTRNLKEKATPEQKQHWKYIDRINRVWAERAAAWKPDLVQAHDLDALRAAVLVGEELGIPVIYDTHELWSEQPFIDSVEAVAYWNNLEGELVPSTDAVMTVNTPLAEILQEKHGLNSVLALHNCQEKQSLPPPGQNEKPIALYQGAYVPHRGLEQLIVAAEKMEHVQVAFRGFGGSEAELRELDRDNRIVWHDPVPGPQVVQAAAAADIGLIPFLPTCLNHYYSTPNKLFEYMSAGLAVAGSDIPEIHHFVQKNELGGLFDPYCPADIAETLDRLALSHQLPAMKTRSRQLAQETWNWENEVQKYLNLVKQLCANSS